MTRGDKPLNLQHRVSKIDLNAASLASTQRATRLRSRCPLRQLQGSRDPNYHVTHGAVSQHVRLLEEWLGAPLFERHNRRVVLTPAARAYLAEIGPAFEQVASATARYGYVGGVSPRLLRVNGPATFALRWLVPRLAGFQKQHPGVEVRLDTSNEPVEALQDTYDIIIRGGPDTFYGYSMRPFLSEERLPVCSPALLDQLPLGTPRDLIHHTLLHTSSLPRLWSDWLAISGSCRSQTGHDADARSFLSPRCKLLWTA